MNRFSLIFILFGLLQLAHADLTEGHYLLSDYFGVDNLVGVEHLDSLPSGQVTFTEKNLCPATYSGGTLVGIYQFSYVLTNARRVKGQAYIPFTASPPTGVGSSSEGTILQFPKMPFPQVGRTITYTRLFVPAVYHYSMSCHYSDCANSGTCQWNAPAYAVAFNLSAHIPPKLNLRIDPPAIETAVRNEDKTYTLPKTARVIEMMVPIHGEGLDIDETRKSMVQVKFGAKTFSRELFLANLRGSYGYSYLPFFVSVTEEEMQNPLELIITVNDDPDLLETNLEDNKYIVKINSAAAPKLCNVKDKGRIVEFMSQASTEWNGPNDYYAGTPGKTMQKLGCGTTALSMLFKSYGILKNFDGSAQNPGSLNKSMSTIGGTNSKTNEPFKLGYNTSGSILWAEAAQVARKGYAYQCSNDPLKPETLENCSEEAKSKVSFKESVSFTRGRSNSGLFFETRAQYEARMQPLQTYLIDAIEAEICNGNPVVLQMDAPTSASGMHFVLATETVLDQTGKKTFYVNNPAVSSSILGERQLLPTLKRYPFITGYRLYRPAKDPAMIFARGSENIHYIVTDPDGKRVGYDPINNINYNEIPKAKYYVESVNTPIEEGIEPETLVVENAFEQTEEVKDGSYNIKIYGTQSGPFNFIMTSHDFDGQKNNEANFSASIAAGEVKNFTYKHTSVPLPVFNTMLEIKNIFYSDFTSKKLQPLVFISGKLSLQPSELISLEDSFQLSIGSPTDFTKTIDLKTLKVKKLGKVKEYYLDLKGDEKIILSPDGAFTIQIRSQKLVDISNDKKKNIFITIGSKSGFKKVDLLCKYSICVKK